jgi:hypothetical protein
MIVSSGRAVLLNPGPVNVSPPATQALQRGDRCGCGPPVAAAHAW